jgi:TetR/AcrR family transcriptional regulator, transcriptional repressor for nem operon
MSFNDLTAELGTTRTNIHYHFGLKSHLAEEVLDEQVNFVLSTYRSWWLNGELSLKQKLLESSEFNEQRYKIHNPNDEGRIWSLITRFRFDEDVITPKMKAKLAEFSLGVESAVKVGVNHAVESEELCATAPVDEIVCLIADVIHCSSLISHAPYGIGHLILSYKALSDLIFRAYGKRDVKQI